MKGEEGSSKRNFHLMRIRRKIYLPKKISNSIFISIRPPMKEGILQAIFQFSSVTQSCPTLWPRGLRHARPPCPSPTPGIYSNSCLLSWWCHPTICHPILLPPSICPNIRVFSSESVLRIRWTKYWSISFNIGPSNEYSGLISFRMDWLDLLAVQGTLKSLLQHHTSKAPILWCSAFFTVQLSHPYMTTGKTKDLIIQLWRQSNVCFLICCLGWS